MSSSADGVELFASIHRRGYSAYGAEGGQHAMTIVVPFGDSVYLKHVALNLFMGMAFRTLGENYKNFTLNSFPTCCIDPPS